MPAIKLVPSKGSGMMSTVAVPDLIKQITVRTVFGDPLGRA